MRQTAMVLRIATIGRSGQTARAIAAVVSGDPFIELIQAGSAEADLRDAQSIARFIDAARPDVVINTGAYTYVDRAESEPDEAMRVNADGPLALAQITRTLGLPFIHMSTDCVFDGRSSTPYTEDDTPSPLSAYGRSKLAGEQAVAAAYPAAVTARVCWVYSEFGVNFFTKMLALARTQPELQLVSDQIGPPTYAPDVAHALLKLAHEMHGGASDLSPLLHLAAPGAMDRASMAREIFEESQRQGGPSSRVLPVLTSQFPTPAARPLNARLDGARATARLGLTWTPWREGLSRSVAGILQRS
jgi:dTDP-4-dehydrorhamnose reductase